MRWIVSLPLALATCLACSVLDLEPNADPARWPRQITTAEFDSLAPYFRQVCDEIVIRDFRSRDCPIYRVDTESQLSVLAWEDLRRELARLLREGATIYIIDSDVRVPWFLIYTIDGTAHWYDEGSQTLYMYLHLSDQFVRSMCE